MLTLICSFRRCARGTGSVHKNSTHFFFSSKVWFATRKYHDIFILKNSFISTGTTKFECRCNFYIFSPYLGGKFCRPEIRIWKMNFRGSQKSSDHESHRRSIHPIFSCGCFSRTQRKIVTRSIRWGGSPSSHGGITIGTMKTCLWMMRTRKASENSETLGIFSSLFHHSLSCDDVDMFVVSNTFFFSSSSFSDVKLALSHITSHLCQG